ncbi:hypothetical protein GUITHDRAFT_110431 [Guillardia theta CCMP2712]|uniref:EF-hand domain-containing protein n=1 Tax=Guillardia theta (strain CCMP2712) TaxID=905079 RepID=L1J523_GUITC|nr:hypothetical protein GUITHDRAFT_110431 [Guillardia theta CCMP2712]EKX43633.1 hypothetical protein GUITHDRAFT_110431 [Guillardia theta CCMP2712]|eukprot:XP_005830613.1 hypothetical protein GUITHDRAFT_110431 [Guillardia theta CCMP2712]
MLAKSSSSLGNTFMPPMKGYLYKLQDEFHGTRGSALGRLRKGKEEGSSPLLPPLVTSEAERPVGSVAKKASTALLRQDSRSEENEECHDFIGSKVKDWSQRVYEFDFRSCELRYISNHPNRPLAPDYKGDPSRRSLGFVDSDTVIIPGKSIETQDCLPNSHVPLLLWTFEITFYVISGAQAGERTLVLAAVDLKERDIWIESMTGCIRKKQELDVSYSNFRMRIKETEEKTQMLQDEVREGKRAISVNSLAHRQARLNNGKAIKDVISVFKKLSSVFVVESDSSVGGGISHVVVNLLEIDLLSEALAVQDRVFGERWRFSRPEALGNEKRVDIVSFEELFKAIFAAKQKKDSSFIRDMLLDLILASHDTFLVNLTAKEAEDLVQEDIRSKPRRSKSHDISTNDRAEVMTQKTHVKDPVASAREAFDAFDKDNSGFLDMKEIHAAIKTFLPSVTDKEILRMSRAADADGSGHVTFEEFLDVLGVKNKETVTSPTRRNSMTSMQPCFIIELKRGDDVMKSLSMDCAFILIVDGEIGIFVKFEERGVISSKEVICLARGDTHLLKGIANVPSLARQELTITYTPLVVKSGKATIAGNGVFVVFLVMTSSTVFTLHAVEKVISARTFLKRALQFRIEEQEEWASNAAQEDTSSMIVNVQPDNRMALVSPLVPDSINTTAFQHMWNNARQGKVKLYSKAADLPRLHKAKDKSKRSYQWMGTRDGCVQVPRSSMTSPEGSSEGEGETGWQEQHVRGRDGEDGACV